MAYDQENKAVLIFGGFGNGSHLADTWALDVETKTWRDMAPASSASPRAATTLVYDDASRQMILFGGFGLGHSLVSNETWTYDYGSNLWTMVKARSAPSERASYGMALDSERHQLVLFGGFTELGYFNDLWKYSISEREWTRIDAAGELPAPRGAMSFVYDVKRDAFVMFGGFSDQGYFSDTWTLDPSTRTWTKVATEKSPPPARSRMVYHQTADLSIIFGGDTMPSEGHLGSPVPYGKTWSYSSNDRSWAEMQTANAPMPRALNGIAYDSNEDAIVIFGGTDSIIDDANFVGNEFQDTWVLKLRQAPTSSGTEFLLVVAAAAAVIGALLMAQRKRRSKPPS
jgi:N-acetylneuraminic acid mutarotase